MSGSFLASRRTIFGLAVVGAIAVAAAGYFAFPSQAEISDVNVSEGNVAIHGYDPVAYFTVGKRIDGPGLLQGRNDQAFTFLARYPQFIVRGPVAGSFSCSTFQELMLGIVQKEQGVPDIKEQLEPFLGHPQH